MRKFMMTSSEFNGEVILEYDNKGRLARLDMSNTDLDIEQRHYLKAKVACNVLNVAAKFDSRTLIVEADYEVDFETFWAAYKKKINKIRCVNIWRKLSKTDQVKAWAGIEKYEAFLKGLGWREKADPDTYLRNRYWENEY